MSRISGILSRARETLADPDKDRFTDERLLRLLSEAQTVVALSTGMLITSYNTTVTAISPTIPLPENCISVLRVEWDKVKLPLLSYDAMDAQFGSEWQQFTSDIPTHVVYDLRVPSTLRLWPSIAFASEVAAYGLVTTAGQSLALDYGAAASIPTSVLADGDANFGIISSIAIGVMVMTVYYSRNPLSLATLTAELELPALFDTVLKQYVVGMALRDNMDTQSRAIGADELATAAAGVANALKLLSLDYTANAHYDTTYVGGFNG